MGIDLVFIQLYDDNADLFSAKNHNKLDIIPFSRITSYHHTISNILSDFCNITYNNNSKFDAFFCKNDNFTKVAEKINKYCDGLKFDLDEQYECYKKSKVLDFFKENSYEKIKNLLEQRQYDIYKEIMENCVNIIENDLSENYDLYEYDSYKENLNMYNRIKNISEKLINYSSQKNIYYYLSY
jgi:hypothetical protein